MKIGVVQFKPVIGDIGANLDRHTVLIELAIKADAEMILFPELSITGYEPSLAEQLAVDKDDARFDVLQRLCDKYGVAIGIGAPTNSCNGVCISLIMFRQAEARQVYSKMHLHCSEESVFTAGPPAANMLCDDPKTALAICYELSVPEHAKNAAKRGAEVYIASVADSVEDIDRVLARLGVIARDYSMTVLFSNHVGVCNRRRAAGKTSAWKRDGQLLSQLDDVHEGVIVVDSQTLSVDVVVAQSDDA